MEKYLRRLYQPLVVDHFKKYRQMLFLMGPRQVGKTTLSLHLKEQLGGELYYLNWDNLEHRELILQGPGAIAKWIGLDRPKKNPPLLIFDEIHKYRDWKILIKGFFDTYGLEGGIRIIVTGSARLDIYNFGGDSLMGRYFRYRLHPFSVAEVMGEKEAGEEISPPKQIENGAYENLLQFGGFPEPYLKADEAFDQKWKSLRFQQLFYEDIRELTRIHEIKQMELLAEYLRTQAGSLTSLASLANKLRVSSETVKRWLSVLSQLYFCFEIKPWSKNVTRSLLKEPKIYLWDWSQVKDSGSRLENCMASHLLKACHFWEDRGLGSYGVYFLRDKEKREVDFLITKNGDPWFMVEVKKSDLNLSPSLEHFQAQIGARHAFQVVFDMVYEEIDCFSYQRPVVVPAKTFLSQLV